MKKTQYISPKTEISNIEAQNMLALSKVEGGVANENYEVLINENKFTDIWENEL